MPFVSVNIHFVWSTRNRVPYLRTKELRNAMWQHIKQNGKEKYIFIDFVNGHQEHCHCLVSLGTEQTISKIMQLIKGESAYWFNKQNFIEEKLEWQDEYFAVSVSASMLDKVRDYIKIKKHTIRKKHFSMSMMNLLLNMALKKLKMSEITLWLKPKYQLILCPPAKAEGKLNSILLSPLIATALAYG
ncbi:MAG: IS200/IS605 family transposase [Chitinophagaceae bacterium]